MLRTEPEVSAERFLSLTRSLALLRFLLCTGIFVRWAVPYCHFLSAFAFIGLI